MKRKNEHIRRIKYLLENWDSPQVQNAMNQMDKYLEEIHEQLINSPLGDEIRKDYETKEKGINGFQMPFVAINNEDYRSKLKEKLEAFIREIDRPAFRNEGNLVEDVKKICQKIIEALDAIKAGQNKKAENLITDILEEYKKYPFAVSELDKSYAFRGVAPFEELRASYLDNAFYENMSRSELSFYRARIVGAEEEIHDIKDINYLPYSMRDLSKDMRFSSKGKVCFYLGTTSYVCSKECRWNKKDPLYLSGIEFNKKGKQLKILNLVVLESLMNGLNSLIQIKPEADKKGLTELHNAMIRIFPLAIATMFTIQTPDEERKTVHKETSKDEYLLSQVLMNVLNQDGIDGVAYLSRQGNDDLQYPQMVCLAIPVQNMSDTNEYGDLIDCYSMTKPVLFNELEDYSSLKNCEKRSYINEIYPKYYRESGLENINAKVQYEGLIVFYQDLPFSKADDFIVNQKYLNP